MREEDSVLSRDYRCNILANCPADKVEYNNSEVLTTPLLPSSPTESALPCLLPDNINFLKMINKSCGCGWWPEFYTKFYTVQWSVHNYITTTTLSYTELH